MNLRMPLPAKLKKLLHPRWLSLAVIGLCLGYATTVLTRMSLWGLLPAFAWLRLGWVFRWGAPASAAASFVPRLWTWSLLPIALWGLYLYLAESFGIVDLS